MVICDAGGVEAGGRVYAPADRPLIEVLVDETWRPGELRAWSQREGGAWWGNVSWSAGPGLTYLDTVPAERLRPVADENDDPSGRGRT